MLENLLAVPIGQDLIGSTVQPVVQLAGQPAADGVAGKASRVPSIHPSCDVAIVRYPVTDRSGRRRAGGEEPIYLHITDP
jgi:hypothetical protein